MITLTEITLEYNKANYSIPGMVKFVRAGIVGVPGFLNAAVELMPISPALYEATIKDTDIVGIPTLIAIIGPELEMFLWPKPVEPWEMFVESYNDPPRTG